MLNSMRDKNEGMYRGGLGGVGGDTRIHGVLSGKSLRLKKVNVIMIKKIIKHNKTRNTFFTIYIARASDMGWCAIPVYCFIML